MQLLPDELLENILHQITFESLVHLSSTCRTLRRRLCDKDSKLAKSWLLNEAKSIKSVITLETSISKYDDFIIGVRKFKDQDRLGRWNNGIFVHHIRRSDALFSDVYIIHFAPTGTMSFEKQSFFFAQEEMRHPCLHPTLAPSSHSMSCLPCQLMNPGKILVQVSKNYPVFFQNWKDEFKIRFPEGHTLILTIQHVEKPGFLFSQLNQDETWLPDIQTFRHDLLETNNTSKRVEKFFKLDAAKELERNANQYINPWL